MNVVNLIVEEVGLIGRRAKKLLSDSNVLYLFQQLGLEIDANTYISSGYQRLSTGINAAVVSVDTLIQAVQAVESLVAASTPPDSEALMDLADSVYNAIDNLLAQFAIIKSALDYLAAHPTTTGPLQQTLTNFAQQFLDLITQHLLITHLQSFHGRLFAVLQLLGVVRDRVAQPIAATTLPSPDKTVHFAGISALLRSPADYLRSFYGWGAASSFAYRRFLLNLKGVLNSLGLPVYFAPNPYSSDVIPLLHINSFLGIQPSTNTNFAFDIILENSALAQSILLPVNLAGWEFEVGATVNLDVDTIFRIKWDGSLQATLPPTSPAAAIALSVSARLPQKATEYALLTTPFSAGLTASAIELKATFITPALITGATTTGNGTMAFTATFASLTLSINPGEGDSFISKLFGKQPLSVKSDVTIAWTQTGGLSLRGGSGLLLKKTINLSLGPVQIPSLALGLVPESDAASVVGLLSATAQLGPVYLMVDELGFQAKLEFEQGNLGPFGIVLGFKAPKGIGIIINTDTITGGGYLFIDQANHKYSGAAQLTFKDKINLNALGLLQTVLPNNRPGYSFLLLITAQFNPIQLGLGFTLNGVGGLVGINRSVSVPTLRTLVQDGRTDSLLFPANVLDNPQASLTIVDNAFPAAEGKYVFGLMAKIGWGSGNLITLDAALIIQLPAPVLLVLLGILRATLPNERSPIIRIRADFLGVVDFGAKKISFDAVLVKSSILQFALDGTFAFRLYQGDNPVFLMTAGGFHPAFHPPANAELPNQRRLTLSLASGGDFRLTLSSYIAITSNTVQFGSRLDLFVDLPGPFTLVGFLGFDALFRFNPFYLEVHIGAGVAIKRGSRSVLSISLDLLVSGPAPWHIEGTGSFKILFFKIKFRINRTFGGGSAQPALPSTDVRQLLRAALEDKVNWEVQAPPVKPGNTVVLRTEDHPTELVVDPGGVLAVQQKITPLNYPLDFYGNTRPTNGNQFIISSVELGLNNPETIMGSELRDNFSPSQFRRMSDQEKLSAPSFQRMPNGLRMNTLDGLKGQSGFTRHLEFEQKLVEPNLTSNRPAGGSSSASISSVPTDPWPVVPFSGPPIPGENMTKLARTGAVGRSRRSYEQRRPSRLAPDQVLWDEDSYVITSVRTLEPDALSPNPFLTEAEATAYMQRRLATNPSLAGELQVIPVYQLDVTAPAAANLVPA